MLKGIKIFGWRQYKAVDISFHPRLTVVTGANGAGKTTLINLIAKHFGWNNYFVSTPLSKGIGEDASFATDVWDVGDRSGDGGAGNQNVRSVTGKPIGKICYMNDMEADLLVPEFPSDAIYGVEVPYMQGTFGLHIPSHRQTFSYQKIANLPISLRRRHEISSGYFGRVLGGYVGNQSGASPHHYMKEALIALAVFGYESQVSEGDPESVQIYEEFQEILRKILPPKLGFQRLVVRIPEIVLETRTGEFSFDSLSGGIAAIVDLVWQIFMYQGDDGKFVVTMDEPENHLHPELQRRVLVDLMAAFPTVQFIVATHSPFIVGSVPDSNVYVLSYDENNKVNSQLLDTINKGGSANEILRDVLGLDFTMPIWVENKIEALVKKYSSTGFSSENIAQLRMEMEELGLTKHVALAINALAEQKERQ
ncbi:AAA family ATPase [Chitinimonas arctica]|uniref:AAA family ATPase n=1 Tax=Chitinimonas arctica TaxID=2594795 RepID=A0A516SKZ9_9NEIS|nr:AAA family ATPase [Chitinimonas arctica]QDQ28824.1 AAA family ATPase [Chitinimonas arctica]